MNDSVNLGQDIDAAAQQCVKCGLCLPHCPTYQVAENENESPRGRIALMQGAVRKQVPMSELLTYHLDTCLACRACEAVCPAGVKYEQLITSTRAWLQPTHKSTPLERLLIYILEHRWLRGGLAKSVKFVQHTPWLRNILGSLDQIKLFSLANYIYQVEKTFLKKIRAASPQVKPAQSGTVLLQIPCASEVFDPRTISDAQQLLTELGWNVLTNDACCGALSLHAGELKQAQACAAQQIKQWRTLNPDVIISLATGCHATLQEYPKAPLNQTVPHIALPVLEEFILQQLINQKRKLKPLPLRAVLQTPCTLRNALRKPQIVFDLLQKIPEIECITISVAMGCCGAAGSYFFRHADIAKKLVSPIVEFMREHKPDIWVSSNIGCALHIQQALRLAGLDIPVLHPISLIHLCLEA